MEAGTYRQACHRMADDVRTVPGGDDGINPRAAGDVGGLQLGAHAAAGRVRRRYRRMMARSASSMP